MSKEELFQKIHSQIQEQQYDLIDQTVNEILKSNKNDKEAQQIKVANLLHRGQYQSCLEYCKSINGFVYEQCYCYYRLNDYEKALQHLPQDATHLKFQILYRLQQIQIPYQKEQAKDEELTTNILAALFVSQQFQTALEWITQQSGTSFELAYNISMIYLGLQQFERALEWIEKAKQKCQSQFKDQPSSLQQEYPVVLLQEAFIYQSRNQLDKAQSIYKQIISMQTEDLVTLAIANVNLTILHSNEASLYELQKHIKSAEKLALSKWTQQQWEIIQTNHLILLMNMKKFDECRDMLNKFKNQEEALYWKAMILFREKKNKEARELLSQQKTNLKAQLTMIQMDLYENNTEQVLSSMKQLVYQNHFRLGLLSSYINLISKYSSIQERSNAIQQVLQDASDYFKKQSNIPHLFIVLNAHAQLSIQYEQYSKAAQILESILQNKYYSSEEERLECISNLVNAYFNFDSKKAEMYVQELPTIPIQDLSLDKLENENSLLNQRKKLSKEMQDMIIKGEEKKNQTNKNVKKQVKRKNKMPKNYDPKKQPDPERWLPKKERSQKKQTTAGGTMKQMAASQGSTIPTIPTTINNNNNNTTIPSAVKSKGKPVHHKKRR